MASDDKGKRMKGDHGSEGEKQRGNKREDSGNCSKENTNKKPDYIHVRARRGQATDSHSLAERVSAPISIQNYDCHAKAQADRLWANNIYQAI